MKKAKAARTEALMRSLKVTDEAGDGQKTAKKASKVEAAPRDVLAAEKNATDSLKPVVDSGDMLSPSSLLFQDPMEFLNFDLSQDQGSEGLENMDWTNWNEFVSDAYPDATYESGVPFPVL